MSLTTKVCYKHSRQLRDDGYCVDCHEGVNPNLKMVKLEVNNVFIGEVQQQDKTSKRKSPITKFVLLSPQITQEQFNKIFSAKKYRVDISFNLLIDETELQTTTQGKCLP